MTDSRKMIATWLLVVCATIFAMIVVGGITRLTGSGLSMVDWRPILGVLPPMNAEEWQAAFSAYQQFPEYQIENRHMDLAGFKEIFYWEYGHRLLGRLIGLIYFLPFVTFWLLGRLDRPLIPKLLVGLVLGGLQGLMGWYMVKSGLIDIPRVSHYRLAAHLMLAMVIFCYLFWLALGLLDVSRSKFADGPFNWLVYALLGSLVVQITWGAFTAGSHAGLGYNTYPMMNDQWIADAVFAMQPWWLNLFESTATVQFVHRWVAVLVLGLAFAVWVRAMTHGDKITRAASVLTLLAILGQFVLGVLTLIYVIPLGLASAHQGWACIVLMATVYLAYVSQPAAAEADRR